MPRPVVGATSQALKSAPIIEFNGRVNFTTRDNEFLSRGRVPLLQLEFHQLRLKYRRARTGAPGHASGVVVRSSSLLGQT
jgi:hypothetical protein